jgi:hypothetical protein
MRGYFAHSLTGVSADPKRISREVSDEMMSFMRELNISDPDEQELAAVFALAFAGGVIAARMKLLPWNRRRIGSVIARYYRMARGEMVACLDTGTTR